MATNPGSIWNPVLSLFNQRMTKEFRNHTSQTTARPKLEIVDSGWLKGRALFWPSGGCNLRRISLVSSRLPERRDLCSWWYDILRTTVARCDSAEDILIAVSGTTAFKPLIRASELFGVPRLEPVLPKGDSFQQADAVQWLDAQLEHAFRSEDDSSLCSQVVVSPRLTGDDIGLPLSAQTPFRDIVNFALADRIVLMHSASGGHTARLTHQHLQEQRSGIVMVAVTENTSQQVAEFRNGTDHPGSTVPWYLFSSGSQSPPHPDNEDSLKAPIPGNFDRPAKSLGTGQQTVLTSPEDWLCHWTRPFRSAWPDQKEDDFLDELILGCASRDRSAFAALVRILQRLTIYASVARTGQAPVVSLTAVPLTEFRQRRIFRRHRRRFDFEPYGLAIRRQAARKLGARAVQYLDDKEPSDESSDAFTQPRFDRTGKIDWSIEREWRIVGNFNLQDVEPSDLCVFVNDEAERLRLSSELPYQVVVVPE